MAFLLSSIATAPIIATAAVMMKTTYSIRSPNYGVETQYIASLHRNLQIDLGGRAGTASKLLEDRRNLAVALVCRDQQHILGVDRRLAVVERQLVLVLEHNRVGWAGILAIAAEDAAQHIDLVGCGVALTRRVGLGRVVLARNHQD